MRRLIRHYFAQYIKGSSFGVWLHIIRRNCRFATRKCAWKAMDDFGYGSLADTEKKALYQDMRHCFKKLHFVYDEYFTYGFTEIKSDDERHAYVPDNDRIRIIDKLNSAKDRRIFVYKPLTAETFAEYFGREFCVIQSRKDAKKLEDFLSKHKRVVIKPIEGTFGIGVRIVQVGDGSDISFMSRELAQEYELYYGAIVEEIIVQDERLARLHPQSVNTVRITTFRLDSRIVIFHPNLRVGRGDSCVDNAAAGGLLCPIDVKTGRVILAGDKKGARYEKHPETGEYLMGFEIPRWGEAVKLVERLARVVPNTRHVGWDLALTNNGWILVEANQNGQWGGQYLLKQGFREEVEGYLRELGIE